MPVIHTCPSLCCEGWNGKAIWRQDFRPRALLRHTLLQYHKTIEIHNLRDNIYMSKKHILLGAHPSPRNRNKKHLVIHVSHVLSVNKTTLPSDNRIRRSGWKRRRGRRRIRGERGRTHGMSRSPSLFLPFKKKEFTNERTNGPTHPHD